MADIKYTESQANAVNAPVCDLLVSAAAGSGKTAVLTGRLVREMCEENIDITKMLIVTYTKAAASQLREKIAKAIHTEIGKNPSNKSLRRQLSRLERAQISTIHSFCYEIVRSNFTALGLPASVRIGDSSEMIILSRNIMDKMIDDLYESNPNFAKFADNYSPILDDSVASMLLSIYNAMMNMRQGIEFVKESYIELDSIYQNSNNGRTSSKYFKYIYERLVRTLESYKICVDKILENCELSEERAAVCGKAFKYLSEYIDGFLAISIDDKKNAQILLDYISAFSCPNVSGKLSDEESDFKTECQNIKKDISAYIRSLSASLAMPSFELECQIQAEYMHTLYEALLEFDKRFRAEKSYMGILDYSDLERYTLKLLTNDDGSPSERAYSVVKKYERIYIDEYQDVNEVQDAIFTAISNSNRFMVGDIKQSIYRFRGAEPSLFSDYRNNFKDYGTDSESGTGKRIFLSENFRSDKPVIDFTNMIFEKLFNNNSGRVPYMKEDALVHKKGADEGCVKPEIVLIENSTDEGDSINPELEYVSCRIRNMIADGVTPSDIAVLARDNDFLDEISKKLTSLGVSNIGRGQTSLFDAPDILVMICLLNCIDNPNRDIYLAGALKSPIYGITLEELSLIRNENKNLPLYTALCNYTEKHGFEKGKGFIKSLEEYRVFAANKSSDKIIWHIICKTTIRASAAYYKLNRSALMKFYSLANNYEKNSFKGLHSFIGYLNSLIEKHLTDDSEKISADVSISNKAVNLMTIHQSKGLEFKYVFLCNTKKQFSNKSTSGNILYEKNIGIASKLRDESGIFNINTQARSIISSAINENIRDEMMRVLYVALTRPRMALIITFCHKDIDEYYDKLRKEAAHPTPMLFSGGSLMKWIIYALDDPSLFTKSYVHNISYDKEDVPLSQTEDYKYIDHTELFKRLDFEYPKSASSKIPTKLSVSKLFPEILDETDGELLKIQETEFMAKPAFMEESVRHTASDRGTATHLFMQFCDFENAKKFGARAEADRLVKMQYITKEIASIAYIDKIDKFFQSNLYNEIASATKILREKRFNTRLPAADFTMDADTASELEGETILVQGVIDCLITQKNGSFKLIDYKTDYVDNNDAQSENILIERYRTQLSYYRKAIEAVTGKPVDQTVIYSFYLEKEIVID